VKQIYYGWWVVFACFVFYFLVSSAVFSFTAFFEPISKEFGWSYTQISIAASIRGLELGLFGPVTGYLVDRFGARKLLFFGTLTTGIGFILLGRVNSLPLFYFDFIVLALGMSACTGTVLTTAVGNWFKKDVGKALGIISAGVGVGGLSVPIIIALINSFQWRTTFIIIGLAMWMIGLPVSFIVRRRPEDYGYTADGAAAETQPASAEDQDKGVILKEALKTRIFWHVCIAEAMRVMAMLALITHVMPYLNSLGTSRSRAALVAGLIPVFSIAGRLIFGWLGDIFNKYHVMALVYFMAGVGLLAFAYIQQVAWLIIPFMILFPLSWGAQPLRGAIIREYFGRASLGTILGIISGITSVVRIAGPTLAGLTYDTFGHYRFIWLFLACTFAISVFLMLRIKPDEQ